MEEDNGKNPTNSIEPNKYGETSDTSADEAEDDPTMGNTPEVASSNTTLIT